MNYEINENCINCGVCVNECNVNAINEGDLQYIIDENICINCGDCELICPVNAIVKIPSA